MEKVWARFTTGKGSSETVGEGFRAIEWTVVASTSAPDVRWVCCSVLHVSEGIPLIRVWHVHKRWRDIPLSFTACESIWAQCRRPYCAVQVLHTPTAVLLVGRSEASVTVTLPSEIPHLCSRTWLINSKKAHLLALWIEFLGTVCLDLQHSVPLEVREILFLVCLLVCLFSAFHHQKESLKTDQTLSPVGFVSRWGTPYGHFCWVAGKLSPLTGSKPTGLEAIQPAEVLYLRDITIFMIP